MGSNTPATDTADPQDGLVVSLPPEILAMMAASEADVAKAESDGAETSEACDPAVEADGPDAPSLGAAATEGDERETLDLDAPALDAPRFAAEDRAPGEAAPAILATAEASGEETADNPALDAEMAALLASLGAAPAMDAAEPAPAVPSEPVEGETVLQLPAVLDLTAAAGLHADLLAHRGTPLALDASEVKRLGGQCLQLLISASRTFAADGVPLRLAGTSEAFQRDLGLMGLSCDDLLASEAA